MQCIGGFLSAPLDSDNPWNHGAYEGMPYEEMVENAAGGLDAGLILGSDGIVMPRDSDTEQFETAEPEELFRDLSNAG